MKNKLQKLLRKYNEENLNWNVLDELMNYLKSKLNNCQSVTNEEIQSILSFQDEEGKFSLVEENFISQLPWEGKLDLIYFPSYYMTLILVKYSNLTNSSVYQEEIKKALDFCCSCKFYGHGYDSVKTQIEVANLFVENGIKKYIKNNHLEGSNISKLLNKLVEIFTQMILEGKTEDYFAGSYLEGMERFINNMDDSVYYVAYGSNLNKEQMMARCPSAECIGPAILENYKLKFNLYLTVEPQENNNVPVGIWKITKEDERKLDRYEGFPTMYRKEYVNVQVNGIKRKCLIYIMNYIPNRMNCKPTFEYLERCQKGYMDFGFDPLELFKYC